MIELRSRRSLLEALIVTPEEQERLEAQLKTTTDARVYRRTLAILEVARGHSVAEVAKTLRVSRQSVYHWIAAYSQQPDPQTLQDHERSGRPGVWTEERMGLLVALLSTTPDRLGYFAMNWTVPLLLEQMEHRTGQRIGDHTLRRELKRQGYRWKRPRYVLAPDPDREKKTLDPAGDKASSPRECSLGGG